MERKSKTIVIVGGSFGGIHAAWQLRHRLPKNHRIVLLSDKPRTIIRASFPRVIFEDVQLNDLSLDLAINFSGSGITFILDPVLRLNETQNFVIGKKGRYAFDILILATGARHAYEELPGSKEYALSICDPARILETREAVRSFTGGHFFAGVGGHYTPCDGPPIEVLMDLDHRLRKLGTRRKSHLHFITDKEEILPPGGPQVWSHLKNRFRKRNIHVHLNIELTCIEKSVLRFRDGTRLPYAMCVLIPPFRGIRAFARSPLVNEKGFVPVDWNTMRADASPNRNIYAVGDCSGLPGPKQAHLALMQATIAAEHIAWRLNGTGSVRAYLPEFRCVMDQGGGRGLYIFSQWMSDGDEVEIVEGREPYLSKIKFERLFFEKRGDIGELHHQMMK